MTACPKWKEGLLDFALGVPASSELEAHWQNCAACSAALAEWRARRGQMDRLLPELLRGIEPSAAFRARLLDSLDQPRVRMPWSPLRVGVLAAVAVAVVAAIFLVSSDRWRPSRAQPDATYVSDAGLTQWRSPTDALLRSSADELLRSGPRLGEFYFPLRSTPSGADAEKSKWRNQ